MKKTEISLVLPCYNESEHLSKSFERILFSLNELKTSYEVIFVEDKSTDSTKALLKQIIKKYKSYPLRLLIHEINKGRGASVGDGIKYARGEIVGFIDIDCEIAPTHIKQFIAKAKKEDVVVAQRVYAFKIFSIHRWLISKIYALIIKNIFHLPIHDSEAGYKFFQRSRILPVLNEVKDKKWFWDTEIIVRSMLKGLSIKEIRVSFIKRNDKTSTVHIIKDSIEYLRRLLMLKLELRNSKKPKELNFWRDNGDSFSQFYKELKTLSPKNYVSQFLNLRTTYLLKLINNEKLGFVLDIGCGSGIHISLLSAQSKFIEGIDISKEMINMAKKELAGVDRRKWNLTVGNAESLPYNLNKFDTVISLGLLDYVNSPKLVLDQCRRVLKVNGLLIITIPKKPSLFSIFRTSLGNKVKRVVFNLPPVGNVLTKKEITDLVCSSGFKIETINSVWTTMWIVKARRV